MTTSPSIYYWNYRRCMQSNSTQIMYLTATSIFSHVSSSPVVRKNVQIFWLGEYELLYYDADGSLVAHNMMNDREAEFIYRPLKYDGYTDFIQDMQNQMILRRKHLELLDMERLVVKQRYNTQDVYCDSFCSLSDYTAFLCNGRYVLLIDFRTNQAAQLLADCGKISQIRQFENISVLGYYDGCVQIIETSSRRLLFETFFTGFASSVPVGQIIKIGAFLFVSAHWYKIKRISLTDYAEYEKGNLGSIYGFAPLNPSELLVAGCDGVYRVVFDS